MWMLVRDECGNGTWINFGTEVRKFSNLLHPLLVPLIPQATMMGSVRLNKRRHRLREMRHRLGEICHRLREVPHAIWTGHETRHQMDHPVLEDIGPTP